jgi:hypothetical protein
VYVPEAGEVSVEKRADDTPLLAEGDLDTHAFEDVTRPRNIKQNEFTFIATH